MRPAEDVTYAPLAATLERLSTAGSTEEGMGLSARLGLPDGPGWIKVADLVTDLDRLDDAMRRMGQTYGLENRAFAGTFLLRDLLWTVLAPAVAVFLAERRLPDLDAQNVAVRVGEDGFCKDVAFLGARFLALPEDPEAGHPDAVVVPVEDVLDLGVRIPVSEAYLQDMIPALRELRVRRGTRLLGRVAADVCVEAFIYVGRGLGREEEGLELATRLLAGPPPLRAPLDYRVIEFPGGSETAPIRNACCLYYKTGAGTCFTCPRKTDEERARQLSEAADVAREGEGS